MRSRIRLLIVLTRPAVFVLLVLYAALGLAAAGQAGNHLLLLRVLVPVVGFLLFSVACNDLADEEIDRVNLPGDPRRPLVSGGALRSEMVTVAVVSGLTALVGSLLLGARPLAVTAAGLAVSAGYSLRPVRLADRGAVAALVLPAGYVAVPYLDGRLATGTQPGGRDLLLLAGLYVGFIGRILLKDFRDVRGDALFGKRTFLLRHGRDWTCRFSAVCWSLGAVATVLCTPRPTVAFDAVTLLHLAAVLWLLNRLRTETHPRRESHLISATAILGRSQLLTLLAELTMRQLNWSSTAAQAAVLGALLVLALGQAWLMVRLGPVPRLYAPVGSPARLRRVVTSADSGRESSATSETGIRPNTY